MVAMELRALTWNLFHGRDHPPDRALYSWRSRLWRRSERDRTHVQVNRDLFDEFAAVIARARWDVALFQEMPAALGGRARRGDRRRITPGAHLAQLASRGLRGWLARLNPDLIASNEGGSNLTLVRGRILERRTLELTPGPRPERRVMAFTRCAIGDLGRELCVANLHASAGPSRCAEAEREVRARRAARHRMGGRRAAAPRRRPQPAAHATPTCSPRLAERLGLSAPTAPGSLDHLLARGLEPVAVARAWPPERRELDEHGLRGPALRPRARRGDFRLVDPGGSPRPPGK